MKDDRGVAVIIGAILLIGIATAAVATYRLTWIPVVTEEREVGHMDLVHRELADVVAALDGQTVRGAFSSTLPLAVGEKGRTFPELPALLHTVEVRGAEGGWWGVNLSSSRALIVREDGRVVGATEDFIPVNGTTTVDDIADLSDFRIRLDEIAKGKDGESIGVVVRDEDGELLGDFLAKVEVVHPDYHVVLRTRDGSGTAIFETAESYHQTEEFSPYWIDVLDPSLRFDRIVGSSPGANVITIEENGLTGDFSMTYGTSTGVLVGAGRAEASFARAYRSGALSYIGSNTRFPDQTWVIDQGGLVLAQGAHEVFRVAPHLGIELVGGTTRVELRVPSIIGPEATVSGVAAAAISTTPLRQESYDARASDLKVRVTTDHPDAWAAFFRDVALDAGVDFRAYAVTSGPRFAELTLTGTSTNVETYDMFLRVQRATVRVEVDT